MRSNEYRALVRGRSEQGTTIVETLVAAALLLICIAGVLSLFALATGVNSSEGEHDTRNIEFASDKMEQLMVLPFDDATIGGSMGGNATAGGVTEGSPVTSYVDYLDSTGNAVTSTQAFYTRQWQVKTNGTGTLKTITVVTRSKGAGGAPGKAPSATLVSIKANY